VDDVVAGGRGVSAGRGLVVAAPAAGSCLMTEPPCVLREEGRRRRRRTCWKEGWQGLIVAGVNAVMITMID